MGIDKHRNTCTMGFMKIDMKMLLVVLLLAGPNAHAEEKHASFGMLGGQYHRTHTITRFEGGDEEVDDRLQLDHDGLDGYHAEISLKFDFGGQCKAHGNAQLIEGSKPARLQFTPDGDTSGCSLDIVVDDATLSISDTKSMCRSYCGVGGSFDGASFARATKNSGGVED